MMEPVPRYACVSHRDDTWTVIDTVTNKPAALDDQELVRKTRQRAFTACDILNRIEASKVSEKVN